MNKTSISSKLKPYLLIPLASCSCYIQSKKWKLRVARLFFSTIKDLKLSFLAFTTGAWSLLLAKLEHGTSTKACSEDLGNLEFE